MKFVVDWLFTYGLLLPAMNFAKGVMIVVAVLLKVHLKLIKWKNS